MSFEYHGMLGIRLFHCAILTMAYIDMATTAAMEMIREIVLFTFYIRSAGAASVIIVCPMPRHSFTLFIECCYSMLF